MAKKINVMNFTSPTEGYKVFSRFRGVDYSTDETQIDDGRSPEAINIISDAGGAPTKRIGWRTLKSVHAGARVNGIYTFTRDGTVHLLVHCGTAFYRMDADGGNLTQLLTDITDQRSTGIYMAGKLYLLTGGDYLVYDGEAVRHVKENAYVPLTSYGRAPTGGGTTYEKVNLLSPWRRNSFLADGTSTVYIVDTGKIDEGSTVTCKINGAETTAFNVDYSSGKITFSSAPEKPANEGTSNVEICFSLATGSTGKIEKCTICTTYGYNTENRIFMSGNPEEAATEYYSGLQDPTYFPDQNFVMVGSSDFPIINFLKYQGQLLILKRDNRQEATIWNQTAEMNDKEGAIFPIKPATAGVGAIAPHSAANLLDDPLFLSPQGVFAPVTTYTMNQVERNIQRRSGRIDARLQKEKNLQDAIATVWQGYYILCMNNHCYLADANQNRSAAGYEWYYWDNIPATCFATELQDLYFGTADGRVCRFNDDLVDEHENLYMRAYNDDGKPIPWEWRSKMDDFGYPSRYKTLNKRGNAVHLMAFTNGECQIYFRTEKDTGRLATTAFIDRLNFSDVDFKRFTFNALRDLSIVFKIKAKKFKRGQLILRGQDVAEGFGIYSAALHYTLGDYAKAKK